MGTVKYSFAFFLFCNWISLLCYSLWVSHAPFVTYLSILLLHLGIMCVNLVLVWNLGVCSSFDDLWCQFTWTNLSFSKKIKNSSLLFWSLDPCHISLTVKFKRQGLNWLTEVYIQKLFYILS